MFGERFGEAVGQCLEDDRGIVVVVGLEAGQVFLDAEAGGDREAADPVGFVEFLRRDEVGEAEVGALGWLVGLLANLHNFTYVEPIVTLLNQQVHHTLKTY